MNPNQPEFIDCTNAILGVPLLYDRTSKGYGVPIEGHKFMGTKKLYSALAGLGRDLEKIGWLPNIHAFLSAGTQVNKGKPTNAHRLGIAVDFDGFLRVHLDPATPFPGLYMYAGRDLLAKTRTRFACLCSLHFGVVLGDFYDPDHQDHIHADLSERVRWRNSRSQTGLLQAVINAWFGADLAVDRVYGPKTIEAVWKAGQWLGLEGYSEDPKDKDSFPLFWDVFMYTVAHTPPHQLSDEFSRK